MSILFLILLKVGLFSELTRVDAHGLDRGSMASWYNAIRAGGIFDDRKPYFDNTRPTKITAQSGSTAKLSCKVINLSNYTVSWMKHNDLQILAVGPYVYTNDDRYVSIYRPHYQDFQLHINFVKPKDAGIYECQISTEPVSAYHIVLQVTGPSIKRHGKKSEKTLASTLNKDESELQPTTDYIAPSARIVNGEDVYVAEGSMINLTCVIDHARVEQVFWYHEEKVISYYSKRGGFGGVSIVTEKTDFSLNSQLLIRNANEDDQGTYTCSLSNSDVEASTRVFVLKDYELIPEQNSAVMMHSGASSQYQQCLFLLPLLTNLMAKT